MLIMYIKLFFFVGYLQNRQLKIGMACIDIFGKYAVVVPIKSKQEGDVAAGILECLNKMGQTPKIIYADDAGASKTNAMNKPFEERFVELFIRSVKSTLCKSIANAESKGKNRIQWVDYLLEILITYSRKLKHDSHGFTPSEAR